VDEALKRNPALARAVNTHGGELVHLHLLSMGATDGLE
jgi:hypothetical protein